MFFKFLGGKEWEILNIYYQEAGAFPFLSQEEERELGKRIKKGDMAARDTLVRANLRYVVSVASGYQGLGVSGLDLISEGNLGLIIAAKRFDWEKGVRFISFAGWWIRQGILKALSKQSRQTKSSIDLAAILTKARKTQDALEQKLGVIPTRQETAEEMGVPLHRLEQGLAANQRPRFLDSKNHGLIYDAEDHVFFLFHDDEPPPQRLHETISSPAPPSPEEEGEKLRREFLDHAIEQTLTEREKEVIHLYFSLDGQPNLTLDEIGGLYGLSRERIRQIKDSALRELRKYIERHGLWNP